MATVVKRSLSLLPAVSVAALALTLLLNASEAPSQEQMAAEYVGSDLCQECHPDQWDTYAAGIHYNLELASDVEEGAAGCESCHGPGSTHVEMAGTEEEGFREAIIAFSNESPSRMAEQCLTCHTEQPGQQHFGSSLHLNVGVACSSCHDAHEPVSVTAALRDDQPELCFQCHGDKRTEFSLPERHPVGDGGTMVCSDCHTPHGSPNRFSLTAAENETCAECHVDKAGPWVFPHAPVETEGCTACHKPHGGVNPHMLSHRERQFVCLECHTFQPNFHVLANVAECNECHAQIHGSNLDPFFLR